MLSSFFRLLLCLYLCFSFSSRLVVLVEAEVMRVEEVGLTEAVGFWGWKVKVLPSRRVTSRHVWGCAIKTDSGPCRQGGSGAVPSG